MSTAAIVLSASGLLALIAGIRDKAWFSSIRITPIVVLAVFYLWCAMGYWYSEDKAEALRKLTVRLPLLTLPMLYFLLVQVTDKVKSIIALAFCFGIYLPGTVSTINYFNNKALFDVLVLQSKPIPVEFGYGIHHIEFSVLCGLSVVAGLYWIFNSYLYGRDRIMRLAFILFTLGNIVNIHILSARTGLAGMYAALGFMLLYMLFRQRSVKRTVLLLAAAVTLPVLAYVASASLRNRITNTLEDLKTVQSGKDANEHSFAMRVEAWKTAKDVIRQHPLTGAGIGDGQAAMLKQYEINGSNLALYNRKNPHNQLLETAVQSGIIAPLLLLAAMLAPLFFKRWRRHMLVPAVLLLYVVSFQFESVLDMQAGVIPFAFFFAFILSVKNN